MKYNTIIFDLDGTISDSKPGIVEGIKYALSNMNRDIPDENTLELFLGPSLAYSFMNYCGMTEKDAEQATAMYRRYYHSEGWRQNRLYKGIFELIVDLYKAGYRLAIATGKLQTEAVRIIKYFKLYDYFSCIMGVENNINLQKSEMIQEVLKTNKNCIMVGDRIFDISGAEQAGIDSVLAAYGYAKNDEINTLKPTYMANNIDDYYNIFKIEKTQRKGYFVSLEGNDGTGKTTQCRLLKSRLQGLGLDVIATREPGGCPISEEIRALLLDKKNAGMTKITESLLFAAARAQHVNDVIKPAIENRKIVISERFVDSSLAYQGGGHMLGEDLVYIINEPAIDGCLPDLTLLYKVDYKTGLIRKEKQTEVDRIESYAEEFHSRVQASFDKLEKRFKERYYSIVCDNTAEEIAEYALDEIIKRFVKLGE